MKYAFILILVLCSCQKSANQLFLPNIFSDGMVIQRDTTVSIWGRCNPNESIEIDGSWGYNITTISDSIGDWITSIKTVKDIGPFSLTIMTDKDKIKINDILMGEVWLAAGQSNMEMNFDYCCNTTDSAEHELMNANYPLIRMFNVNKQYSLVPTKEVEGRWTKAIKDSIRNFSAVGYFYAKKLHETIDVPIGIINSSWGSSDAESWISHKTINSIKGIKIDSSSLEKIQLCKRSEDWFSKFKSINTPSSGFDLTLATYFERSDPTINYFDYFIDEWRNIDFRDNKFISSQNNYINWPKLELPGSLKTIYESNDFNGVIILKNKFIVDTIKDDYMIDMGEITLGWSGDLREYDFYINGDKVGSTFGDGHSSSYFNKLGTNYKKHYKSYPFTYKLVQKIPRSKLKIGRNEIAIRVIGSGDIGLISIVSKDTEIHMKHSWSYKISAEIYKQLKDYVYPYTAFYLYNEPYKEIKNRPPVNSFNFNEPSSLFNGIINPLIPYTIKGVIWYQGENNAFRFKDYEKLFSSLIIDWREKWQNNFPFYYVQIAPYFNYYGTNALLRDEQRKVLKIPRTGMVVTLDIGENYDIHPSNKHDVGYRLARFALNNQYGLDIIESGPLFDRYSINGDRINIYFNYTGSGLEIIENPKTEFEIASMDKQYFDAKVINHGQYLEVFSDKVINPTYVRYAWADTASATLFNLDGLPASSFTTELE